MIDLHFWPTPTCLKIMIMLEEVQLAYRVETVNIGRGEQYTDEFKRINPNSRVPAIVDNSPADGGPPLAVFESGAILQYLADKSGRFWPADERNRHQVSQWVFWQVGGLGPMAGQCGHFRKYSPETLPYASERYTREVTRLYGVMNNRLVDFPYLAGVDYSIADIAAWPWVLPDAHGQDIEQFPALKRWQTIVAARPAVRRANEQAKAMRGDWSPVVDEETRKTLFEHGRAD